MPHWPQESPFIHSSSCHFQIGLLDFLMNASGLLWGFSALGHRLPPCFLFLSRSCQSQAGRVPIGGLGFVGIRFSLAWFQRLYMGFGICYLVVLSVITWDFEKSKTALQSPLHSLQKPHAFMLHVKCISSQQPHRIQIPFPLWQRK